MLNLDLVRVGLDTHSDFRQTPAIYTGQAVQAVAYSRWHSQPRLVRSSESCTSFRAAAP